MNRTAAIAMLLGLAGVATLGVVLVMTLPDEEPAPTLSARELLGKRLFFDASLSDPPGQSCADCHGAEVGFTGPDDEANRSSAAYEGAVKGRFSNRKPPAAAYAGDSRKLRRDDEGTWVGGMFWDGRATGEKLGDPLAEQATMPFTNPLEHNLKDGKALCEAVKKAPYAANLFEQAWGKGWLDCETNAQGTEERIGRAIAAFERSFEVSPFSSKYDAFLAGEAYLDEQEMRGLFLFTGKGKCGDCHPTHPGPNKEPPVFTDFTYDNLGFPRNPQNPFYGQPAEFNPDGADWIDTGLAAALKEMGQDEATCAAEMGKHKVPTLRNVALKPEPGFVKAFGHNGYFKSLETVVHFYNTRDTLPSCDALNVPEATDTPEGSEPAEGTEAPRVAVEPQEGVNCWPAPEVEQNMNKEELGDLKLTAKEEAEIVAFMDTLSDGYVKKGAQGTPP